MEEERIEILESGCDGFIRKPYRDTEIYSALSTHLGVRFSYTKEKTAKQPFKKSELDSKQLIKLPSNLLDDLRAAAVLLNEHKCLDVIGFINEHNPEEAAKLRNMIENLQYKELLLMLDKIKDKT